MHFDELINDYLDLCEMLPMPVFAGEVAAKQNSQVSRALPRQVIQDRFES